MPTPTVIESNRTKGATRSWERDRRLKAMGFLSYEEYVRSTVWATIRRRYFASDLPKNCVLCGYDERIILHHCTYVRVGEEELTDLAPLCPPCHEFVHGLERDGYIDTLDPAAVHELSDEERVRSNQLTAQQRRERQKGEYMTAERQREHAWRETRRLLTKLRQAGAQANKLGVDLSEPLGECLRAVNAQLAKARVEKH